MSNWSFLIVEILLYLMRSSSVDPFTLPSRLVLKIGASAHDR